MGEIIVKNAVKREKGYLYYIDGEGNLCQAQLKRGRGEGKNGKAKL